MNAHQGVKIRWKRNIINSDGSYAFKGNWKNNLILNSGLDNVGNGGLSQLDNTWISQISYAQYGTGNTPTRRDSNPVTFTTSSGTITSNTSFFTSDDVGRLLKTNDPDGTEYIITSFSSSTSVGTSNTHSELTPYTGTVWYVNETQLDTYVKETNTKLSYSGAHSFSSPVLTNTVSYIFSAESGTVTITEVGWTCRAHSTGLPLFGRDLVPGIGDTLTAGQQYNVIIEISVAFSPGVPTSTGDVGNNGFDTSGEALYWSIGQDFTGTGNSFINDDGSFHNGDYDPRNNNVTCVAGLTNSTITFPAGTINSNVTLNALANINLSRSSYTNGTYFLRYTGTFSVSQGNSTNVTGIGMAIATPGLKWFYVNKFSSPQTKDSDHTLNVVFQVSWGRILTN